ncbi:tetratricopeptide repeat-containing sulfotransferase family protein [Maricaulis sp. D1M11]|uniref:tetratricopeptide repeat-containing sulfotransferase family protein n=1 Tax=Maricaulis sp. D1M11 TaxID=3076117 RepID=UPI0039B69620
MALSEDIIARTVGEAQKALMSGRFAEARETLAPILDEYPDHIDSLYALAVCGRYERDFDSANRALERLKESAPEFGRAHQEEAYLRRDQGQPDLALAAFERACRFNPALISSWLELASLYEASGRTTEAEHARAQAQRLKALPQPVLAVTNLLAEGKLLKAETLCRAFLQKNPKHVEAMRLLAEIGVQLGILEDAEFLLESAIAFEPENVQLQLDYIQVLRKRQKFALALKQARTLHAREPDNPLFKSHLAIENMQAGHYDDALTLFDEILAAHPQDFRVQTSRGHALKTMGRQEDAVQAYRQALSASPTHGDAWYGLANLKTVKLDADDAEAMRQAAATPALPYADRIHIHFALAKAFEDMGQYDAAFEHYETGNRLKQVQTRYTSEQMDAEFEAQKRHVTAEILAHRTAEGCPSPDPIFIVGLPRAGSTLLEQILASHSQVDGTLELPNILSLAHTLRGRSKLSDRDRYPRILGELTAEQKRSFGEAYIESTRIHRAGAPFFTDKMPNNFRHIGLIKSILPNAKIIDARREPMACCFSGFKQLFAEGQEFTYGLDEIGRYYRGYVALMAHWDSVLPGEILRVHYEDVVADLDSQVRRLLDFCGLPFEDACLDFHQTDRAVRTASSEQVRQPIFTSGVEQWRHFEPHLEPLKHALGESLTAYRT